MDASRQYVCGDGLGPSFESGPPGERPDRSFEMDNAELLILLESDQQLKAKVDETMRVLEAVPDDDTPRFPEKWTLHMVSSRSLRVASCCRHSQSGMWRETSFCEPVELRTGMSQTCQRGLISLARLMYFTLLPLGRATCEYLSYFYLY